MIANLTYAHEDYGIRLRRLFVPAESRGQGEGTKAMQAFVARFADVAIRLDAYPFEHKPTQAEIDRLVRFYKRFGFSVIRHVENVPQMERIPLPSSVEMHKRMFGAYWSEP